MTRRKQLISKGVTRTAPSGRGENPHGKVSGGGSGLSLRRTGRAQRDTKAIGKRDKRNYRGRPPGSIETAKKDRIKQTVLREGIPDGTRQCRRKSSRLSIKEKIVKFEKA